MNRAFLLCLTCFALSACSTDLPSIDPVSIPAHERASADFTVSPPVSVSEISTDAIYETTGGADEPSRKHLGPVDLPTTDWVDVLEFSDLPISDIFRAVVVEKLGLALIVSLTDEPSASFTGGPFSASDALSSLEDLAEAQGVQFRRVGDIITLTDGTLDGSSSGYTRIYRTNARAVASSVVSLFPNVKAEAIGRAVAVSGPSSRVSAALRMVQSLDRDAASSLPWAVLRLSPVIASEADSIVSALSDKSDPLAVMTTSLDDQGLVLLVGHSRGSLDEAAAVLRAMEEGRPRAVSKSLPVSDPGSAAAALSSVFGSEVKEGSLTISASAAELVFRGSPAAVGEAYRLADKLHGGRDYIHVRAVVAETVRGSSVDRAFSLGGSLDAVSLAAGASSDGDLLQLSGGGFTAALRWLDRDTDTRLLATPRLSVSSGGSANLSVGSQVPIPGAVIEKDGQTRRETQYRDTGVILRVSPRVLSDGRISVTVEQEISTAGANALSAVDSPVFDQRRLNTELVLEPGELVAAGGLDYAIDERATQAPMTFNPSGMTSARKLVVFLTADIADAGKRQSAVDEALRGLSGLLFTEDRG